MYVVITYCIDVCSALVGCYKTRNHEYSLTCTTPGCLLRLQNCDTSPGWTHSSNAAKTSVTVRVALRLGLCFCQLPGLRVPLIFLIFLRGIVVCRLQVKLTLGLAGTTNLKYTVVRICTLCVLSWPYLRRTRSYADVDFLKIFRTSCCKNKQSNAYEYP